MKQETGALHMDDSYSLFLLGRNSVETHPLKSCRQLTERCRDDGEFLTFEGSPEWLSCFARDAQVLQSRIPLLVFRPNSLKAIPSFLKQCDALDVPVAVRCGGTGLAGGCVPSAEGVMLMTGHLKKIKDYDREKGTLALEPGVTVRQLNRYVEADGWYFPLTMASDGVAGIAGCLSTQARGYHQQLNNLYAAVESVTLADGKGQIWEVPAPLVCGAEGLWGVILEIKVSLKRRSDLRQEFKYRGSWHDLLVHLPDLRSLQTLASLFKTKDAFYLSLEGEAWRIPFAASFLQKILPELGATDQLTVPVIPNRKPFVVFSTAFKASLLPEACAFASDEAGRLEIDCLYSADVLAGSLHLTLQAEVDEFSFSQKIERFLTSWADYADRKGGALGSCHGIGMQMRPFMTPFWSEETRVIWQRLKQAFDPNGILGREILFPPPGKSLERS